MTLWYVLPARQKDKKAAGIKFLQIILEGTFRRKLQDAFTNTGFWPSLSDGCHLNRNPKPALERAGFKLKMERFNFTPKKWIPGVFLVQPHMMGNATK